jgi:hypothetical protein
MPLNYIPLIGSTFSKTGTTGAQYCMFGGHGSPDTASDDNIWVAPCAGVLKNFYVYGSVALTGTMTIGVTVYKNGTGATALTGTLSNGVTSFTDSTHSVTVAKGDQFCLQFVYTNTPNATGIAHYCSFYPVPEGVV